jgi:RNA:NAD 2'-phosphotransferase (TPT1/KptA family)
MTSWVRVPDTEPLKYKYLMLITEITQSTWYHGTTDNLLDSIEANGLMPGADGVVWLTNDRDVAFNNGAMRQWHATGNKYKPVVITLDISLEAYSSNIQVKKRIDPEYIVDVGLTPDEQDDYEFSLRVYNRKLNKRQ